VQGVEDPEGCARSKEGIRDWVGWEASEELCRHRVLCRELHLVLLFAAELARGYWDE